MEAAAQRKRQRLQSRRSHGLGTDSPNQRGNASAAPRLHLNPQQLKEHYQTCIQLSTSNKIDTKNAFGLHLIDYMSRLIKDSDEVNFKLATTALDAGTKIYVSRVDCVHSDVSKVANSIVQALDSKSQKKNASEETDEEQPADDPDHDMEAGDEDAASKKTKVKRVHKRKSGSKIAPNMESLNVAKVETNVEIDPIFHKLTTSHDMGNVNSLFLANLKLDRNSGLVLDSNAETDLKPEAGVAQICSDPVSLQEYTTKLREVIDKECHIFDDRFFIQFKFKRNDGNCETEYNRFEDDMGTQKTRTSAFTFDLNADVEEADEEQPADFNLSQHADIFDELTQNSDDDNDDDEVGDILSSANRQSILQAVNLHSLPDLKLLLSEQRDEYSYFKNKITCAWAGSVRWKANQFLDKNMRQVLHPRPTNGQNPPQTVTKRQKKQFPDIDFVTAEVPEFQKAKVSKLKVATLEKWGDSNETSLLPDFLQFDKDDLLRPFNKSDVYFRAGDNPGSVSENTGSQEKRDADFSVAASLCDEGMEVMDGPDEMDFPATQSDDMPFSQQTASQPTTSAFTGENLVQAPDAIKQIDLPFAKYAKRMDVKKLKRVMMDLISNPSLNDSLPVSGGSASNVIRFSDLYQELPAKITPAMTKDMSPPIAFVTLLYLANENVRPLLIRCCHWQLIITLFLTCFFVFLLSFLLSLRLSSAESHSPKLRIIRLFSDDNDDG